MVPFFFVKRRQTQLEQAAKRAGKAGKAEPPALERQSSTGTCKVDESYKKQAALEGLMDVSTVSLYLTASHHTLDLFSELKRKRIVWLLKIYLPLSL